MIDENAIENLPWDENGVSDSDAPPLDRMNESSFKELYATTAQPLWRYLRRVSNNPVLADDLLQETYLRFLRASLPELTTAQQRSYLFKIASRLIQDHWRHTRHERFWSVEEFTDDISGSYDPTQSHLQRREMSQHFLNLSAQERSLLWLAYVEGSEHREIAEMLGLKPRSIRVLLFRARRKLASLIRKSNERRGVI